jgi:uncharacterized RDD family membrane protein YckC
MVVLVSETAIQAAPASDRVVIGADDLWRHFDHQADRLRIESRSHLDRRRRRALWIDNLLLTPVAVACGLTGRGTGTGLVVYLAIMLAYVFVCESLTGQTIGKRVTGLRVLRLDGRPLNLTAVAARSLLLLIDAYFVGYVVMLLTGGRRQRLGDLLAGTVVAEADAFPHRPAHERFRAAILAGYPLAWIAGAVFVTIGATRQDAEARYLAAVNLRCAQAVAAMPRDGSPHRLAMAAVGLEASLAQVPPPGASEDLHRRLLAYEHGVYRDLERASRDLRRSRDPETAAARIRARMTRHNAASLAALRGHGIDACL